MNAAQAYQRTQTETASNERLMVLLFEAALKHMRAAAVELEARHRQEAVTALSKAVEIVAYLSATLDTERVGELGVTLKDLYVFVSGRLLRAATAGDLNAAREAERVFAPIADAFSSAVAQLATTGAP